MTSHTFVDPAVERHGVRTAPRAAFLVRTYTHLFGAIVAFTVLEVWLFRSGMAQPLAQRMLSVNWLLVLGAFMIVSWLASRLAHRASSAQVQYAGLAAFIVAEAVLFVPMLYLADLYAPGAIQSAATLTLIGFAGLTAVVVFTRYDFSFLRGFVFWAMIVGLLLIVGAYLFGYRLGTWFSIGMVGVAGTAILYDTDSTLRRFPTDRHVAASLQLFASVALMFWYVLRLLRAHR